MLRRFPKWFYVVLAMASYLGLHQLNRLLAGAGGFATIGAMAASWGQYLAPGLLLLAAIFLGRGEADRRRSSRGSGDITVAGGAAGSHLALLKVDPFRKVSRDDFHRLLVEFFSRNGFTVEAPPPGLGDGVDLMLSKNSKTYVAQYRHWRELRVGVPMVREQYTVMQAARADGVFVITTGEFSLKAITYAEDKNISLIDGLKLRRLVKRRSPGGGENDRQNSPLCPLCAAEMLRRIGTDKNGTDRRDRRVWICSNYPGCTGTIAIGDAGEPG